MQDQNKNTFFLAIGLILFGAFSRLISVIPNFSAVEALALFGGAYLASRFLSIAIPLIALFVTDLILNNTILRGFYPDHEGFVIFSDYMIWNAAAIILIVLLSKVVLKKKTVLRFAGGVLGATLTFWIISNLGTFISGTLYPKTITGLVACFTAALPFLKNSLIGNVLFASILFGTYEILSRSVFGEVAVKKVKK